MKPEEKAAMMEIITNELKKDITEELTDKVVFDAFCTVARFCLDQNKTSLTFTIVHKGVACPIAVNFYEPFSVPLTSDDEKGNV